MFCSSPAGAATLPVPTPTPSQLPAGPAASVVSIRAARASWAGARKPSGRLVAGPPFLRDSCVSRPHTTAPGVRMRRNPRQALTPVHCDTCPSLVGVPRTVPRPIHLGSPCVTGQDPPPPGLPTWRWTPPGPESFVHPPASASSYPHRPQRLRMASPPAASVPAGSWTGGGGEQLRIQVGSQ